MKYVCTMLLILLMAVNGFAAEATDGVAHVIQDTIQPFLNALLVAVLTAATAWIAKMVKDKTGIELSSATQDRLKGIAFDAIAAVEEKAARSLAVTGQKWASESKHAEAINQILARVPSLTREEADGLLNSALGLFKGVGASKEVGA